MFSFFDSGTAENYWDISLAQSLGIPQLRLTSPITMRGLDGNPLSNGVISQQTPPLCLSIGCLHSESLVLFLTHCPTVPLVLGHPWLQKHNPSFDWRSREITQWDTAYMDRCYSLPLCVCSAIPEALLSPYYEFADVFYKGKAEIFPPHRPYDCTIDLIPSARLPKGRLYALSGPETRSMEEYVQESLDKGFI